MRPFVDETFEEKKIRIETAKLKSMLPASCRDCSFLQITSLKDKKVYCSYMIKGCILQ